MADNLAHSRAYAATAQGLAARDAAFANYINNQGFTANDIYKSTIEHGNYGISVKSALIKTGRLTQGLVYLGSCEGAGLLDDFITAKARVAVGNPDCPNDETERVTKFFRRMDGKEGQGKRPVGAAMAGLGISSAGKTNTTLAPSVVSLEAPCPIKAGDKVRYTLDTTCEQGIVPDIVGNGCNIQNELWINSTTLEGTCTAPPPPGAFEFTLRLKESLLYSDQNVARLDGNTNPAGKNAEGPAHDDHLTPYDCDPHDDGCLEYCLQSPDAVNGWFSDAQCDSCGGAQVLSENVAIATETEICEINLTGGYYPYNHPQADQFTVVIHDDLGGLPGNVLYAETNVVSSRVQTGNVVFGVDEWYHSLILSVPVMLHPGIAWIEIYNATGYGGDDYFWETAYLDPNRGLPGSASASTAPGNGWSFASNVELAMRLLARSQVGDEYCTANPNSTGFAAALTASGSSSSSAGNLQLTSTPVPNQNGVFFHGMNQTQVPFGNGYMCVQGGITRGEVVAANNNSASYSYDNSDTAHSLSAFVGSSRQFQHWFRDPMGGGSFFNLSTAVSITIQP
jgi:hypothetical protein